MNSAISSRHTDIGVNVVKQCQFCSAAWIRAAFAVPARPAPPCRTWNRGLCEPYTAACFLGDWSIASD